MPDISVPDWGIPEDHTGDESSRAEESTDDTYNGWKNYPTWAVHLWLDNDQGSQDWWLSEAVDALNADHPRYEIATALKHHVREECESDDASMASDLLGYALDCVDWYEIADAYLEMAREQVTADA